MGKLLSGMDGYGMALRLFSKKCCSKLDWKSLSVPSSIIQILTRREDNNFICHT